MNPGAGYPQHVTKHKSKAVSEESSFANSIADLLRMVTQGFDKQDKTFKDSETENRFDQQDKRFE